MNDLQQILISGLPLWITVDGYRQAMLSVFPLKDKSNLIPLESNSPYLSQTEVEYLKSHSWYQFTTRRALEELKKQMCIDDGEETVTLTDEYDSPELPKNSIAYHRIWGPVTANSRWWFSSKQLANDLVAAESNPQITSHILHINSPGGEAWYLDRLSEVLRNCSKPIITLYEQMCCSAAYYIGCHGNRIYALTKNDYVGCIGTMCSFYDFEPYFEKLGIKKVEAKATNSDLKNKTFDDLRAGKKEKYIKEILDPLNVQFLNEVRSSRSKMESLPNDAPVLRGEVYYTDAAVEIGLADGSKTLTEVVHEALAMGKEYAENERVKNVIYNIV